MANSHFVVTKMLNTCITDAGLDGYLRSSQWIAMGVPCSAGKGRIDVSGNFWAPKIVSFVMSTDCPMRPKQDEVATIGAKILELQTNTPASLLLAYNPFAVQFWEIDGLPDSDVGFTVDLRSVEAKQHTWKQFLEKKPIKVHLYGRENSWVASKHLYHVTTNLHYQSHSHFRVEVLDIEAMDDHSKRAALQRCLKLRPRRNCGDIF